MNKSRIFFYLSLSFIAGIFGASFYYPDAIDNSWLFLSLIGSIIGLTAFYGNKNICFMVFLAMFFLGGVWLTTARLERVIGLDKEGQNFSGEVAVSKEPAMKDRMQKIIVTANSRQAAPGNGEELKFLITTNSYPAYGYGDKLDVDCLLEVPQNKDGFDYQMYLAKDGIFYVCKNPKIKIISSGEGNRGYAFLLKIKNKLEEKVNRLLPAPESGLLIGIILGGSDGLSQEVQDDFSKTGLTHIVAVSGYNVTIVAEYLMFLGIFLGLWRKQAFWFALIGIFLFVIITGFPASAVRAGVMGGLVLWAMKNGRLANAQNSILFACGAMLVFNPLLLRWDVGFQLSFLATIGIVYFYPLIEKYSIDKYGISFFAEILFLTLSAQVFVLPVILNDFQKLSLISPIANLVILPVVPLAMLLGFLMIIFSFVFPPLATVFAWLAYLPLKYETASVEYMANMKFASVEVMNFSWEWVVIWYIILIAGMYKLRNSNTHGGREQSAVK